MSGSPEAHAVTARAPSSDVQPPQSPTLDHIKIVAPLNGVVSVVVSEGALVKEGDLIATQNSAKTELQVLAPRVGFIRRIVSDRTNLNENDHIAVLEVQ